MNTRSSRFGALCTTAAVALCLTPNNAVGQTLEVSVGEVFVDRDPPPNVTESGEQLPPGAGLRFAWHGLPVGLFLDVEWARGTELRAGAVCGGFVQPGDCIGEPVLYVGGVLFASVGWAGLSYPGESVRFGARPRVSLGAVRAEEKGAFTDREYIETKLALRVGLSAELGLRIPNTSVWLTAEIGRSRVMPQSFDCLDCRNLLTEGVRQESWWVGVAWGS